jgi:hypothetical protein
MRGKGHAVRLTLMAQACSRIVFATGVGLVEMSILLCCIGAGDEKGLLLSRQFLPHYPSGYGALILDNGGLQWIGEVAAYAFGDRAEQRFVHQIPVRTMRRVVAEVNFRLSWRRFSAVDSSGRGSCDRREHLVTHSKGHRLAFDAFSCSRYSGAIHFPERCASATTSRALSYSRV